MVPCYVKSRGGSVVEGARADSEPPTGTRQRTDALWYCRPPADPFRYVCRDEALPWLLETLLIEGHTDDVPVATGRRFRDNLELSSIRAATVHRMITACEPAIDRLANTAGDPILSTSGYGFTRPATPEPDRLAENRRIDLRFLLEPPAGALAQNEPDVQTGVRERMGETEP